MWKETEEAWGGAALEDDFGSSSSSSFGDSSSNFEAAATATAERTEETTAGRAAAEDAAAAAAQLLCPAAAAERYSGRGDATSAERAEEGTQSEERNSKKKRLRMTCRACGCEEIESSEARGELVCCRCGAVLEETALVDSLQFSESATGSISMVGQFVPSCGGISSRSAAGRSGLAGLGSSDSRELALQRGFHNIQCIAESLKLSSQQHLSAAVRLYLMASQRNFTLGRRSLLVASACLYTICRRERTPHLLIDFCDVLRTSVRSLGQVFMKLLRVVHVQVPHVDPSLFMERFASQISLGDKTLAVAQTGVRLIQAMSRDWICTGRRPTGLCGAALLIAARYHRLPVEAAHVAQVVRVSSPTVNKRLQEFRRTAAAQLPAAAFEAADLLSLPSVGQPPCCFQRQRSKQERTQKREPLSLSNTSSSNTSSSNTSSSNTSSSNTSSFGVLLDKPAADAADTEEATCLSDASSSSSSCSFSTAAGFAAEQCLSVQEQQEGQHQQQQEQEEASAHIIHHRGDVGFAPGGGEARTAALEAETREERRRLLPRLSACKAALDIHVDSQLLCQESPSPGDILHLATRIVSAIQGMPQQLLHSSSSSSSTAVPAAAAEGTTAARYANSEGERSQTPAASSERPNEDTSSSTVPLTADLSSSSSSSSTSPSSSPSSSSSLTSSVCTSVAEEGDPLADLLRGVQLRAAGLLLSSGAPAAVTEACTSEQQGESSSAAAALGAAEETSTEGARDFSFAAAAASSTAAAGTLSLATTAAAAAAAPAALRHQQQEEEKEEEEELRRMLLTEPEKKAKALIWDDLTKELMPLVHRRLKERRAREKQQQANRGLGKSETRSSSRNSGRFGAETPVASAAESVRLALRRSSRSIAGKINDNVLDDLFSSPPAFYGDKQQQQQQQSLGGFNMRY